MKMQLMSLTMDNFKCYEHREFIFDGRDASFYGANGVGKTTIYDAFTWLLFGKDSSGSANNEALKPVFTSGEREGQVKDNAAVTSVEAVLQIDGAARTLKRTYYEVWSVKRGSSEATKDGHSSDFYVDGVPVKKNEFDRRVGEIIDPERFRLLTDLFFFAGKMPWKDRRAVLFNVAGAATDGEIMATDARFKPLAESMGTLSLDDYRKTMEARRKGLNKTRNDTPARLDECRKTVENLSGIDFAALEVEWEAAKNARNALRDEIEASLRDSEAEKLDGEIGEARGQLQKLEAANAAWRESQKKPDGTAKAEEERARQTLDELTAMKSRLLAAQMRKGKDLAYLKDRLGDLDREIVESRKEWDRINAEQFHGELCPTCGQKLPQDKLEAAVSRFEADKDNRKAHAVEAADRAKKRRAEAADDLARLERAETEDALKLGELQTALKEAEDKLDALRQRPADPAPEIADRPGYAGDKENLEHQIEDLIVRRGDRLNALAVRRKALRADLDAAQADLGRLAGELAKRFALDTANQRMAQLRSEAQAAAEELAGVDNMLFLCDEFTRYKVKFVEESVNRRFELVKFRLFREQNNGGLEDRCDVTVDGVPWGDGLNTGAKYQAGADIIKTLSRCYGLRVPLFVDGAESVTGPLDAGTQTIRLVVSEGDKELRCEVQ